MLIDCDTCAVRGPACGDCVVSVLLGSVSEGAPVDDEERRAFDVLADSGLVPRLRLVPTGGPQRGDAPHVDVPVVGPRATGRPRRAG